MAENDKPIPASNARVEKPDEKYFTPALARSFAISQIGPILTALAQISINGDMGNPIKNMIDSWGNASEMLDQRINEILVKDLPLQLFTHGPTYGEHPPGAIVPHAMEVEATPDKETPLERLKKLGHRIDYAMFEACHNYVDAGTPRNKWPQYLRDAVRQHNEATDLARSMELLEMLEHRDLYLKTEENSFIPFDGTNAEKSQDGRLYGRNGRELTDDMFDYTGVNKATFDELSVETIRSRLEKFLANVKEPLMLPTSPAEIADKLMTAMTNPQLPARVAQTLLGEGPKGHQGHAKKPNDRELGS